MMQHYYHYVNRMLHILILITCIAATMINKVLDILKKGETTTLH